MLTVRTVLQNNGDEAGWLDNVEIAIGGEVLRPGAARSASL
jgi:hypothetical protein